MVATVMIPPRYLQIQQWITSIWLHNDLQPKITTLYQIIVCDKGQQNKNKEEKTGRLQEGNVYCGDNIETPTQVHVLGTWWVICSGRPEHGNW